MAGRGPAPKPPEQRRRRNKPPTPEVVLPAGPPVEAGQPPLPAAPPPPFEVWPPETLRWWAVWGESAQAGAFTGPEWSSLLVTAVLHARFWSGDASVASELRLREAKHGATHEDRMRLRMAVEKPKPDEAKPQTDEAAASRRRDLKVV